MSSEVPRLSDEQKATIRDNWLDAGYGSLALIDAVEQAVRAQWAAEVERLKRAHCESDETCDAAWYREAIAERDSEQAEAKALRSALGRLESNFVLMLAGKPVRDVEETLAEVRAALQPGDQP